MQVSWLWLWEAFAGIHYTLSPDTLEAGFAALAICTSLLPPTPWTLSFMELVMWKANAIY